MTSISFHTILEAKKAKDNYKLNETSLSRVWQHTTQNKHFAILTSWKNFLSLEENIARFHALMGELRANGLGFFQLKGYWKEAPKGYEGKYEDVPKDQLVDSMEYSLFVPNIPADVAIKIMIDNQQDAIVYAGPETEGKVSLLFQNGSSEPIGEFKPDTVADIYSRIRFGPHANRPFVFEYIAQNMAEAYIERNFWKTIQ